MKILTILMWMLELVKGRRKAEMATVFDVAEYILRDQGPMTTMKLQKLVYYCQAWSLVWDEKPLFRDKIQAWASGPVVKELYEVHRGMFNISSIGKGDIGNLNAEEKATINAVLLAYGDKSAQWLADLTHMEQPWNDAREGYSPGDNCENEITLASMIEYYGSMPPDSDLV